MVDDKKAINVDDINLQIVDSRVERPPADNVLNVPRNSNPFNEDSE